MHLLGGICSHSLVDTCCSPSGVIHGAFPFITLPSPLSMLRKGGGATFACNGDVERCLGARWHLPSRWDSSLPIRVKPSHEFLIDLEGIGNSCLVQSIARTHGLREIAAILFL